MQKFALAPEVYYGRNSLKSLLNVNIKKALIVTDKFMVEFGIVRKITDILDEKNVKYEIFQGVEPNPSLETVIKIMVNFINFSPDCIIGLGGGSPIDAAKGALYFGAKLQSMFKAIGDFKKPYFIAVPTTSGTGSEVTSYSVLTDTKKNTKIALSDDSMLPDMAILDPEFTKTLPKGVIGDTGMDVLTHAVEAYVSKNSNSYTDALALGAIEKVFKFLPKKYEDVSLEEPRIEMQNASCMAGIAFNNSSLGINHSIAHAVGGRFHMVHGKINAILLPYVIRFNSGISKGKIGAGQERYAQISRFLGLPAYTNEEGAKSFFVGVMILKECLEIPKTLKEYGIGEKDYLEAIDELALLAYGDICTPGNPERASVEDIKVILKEAYYGV